MGRMIDVEVEEERIKINFPYERELVDLVRNLPDRWYDNRTRTWFVPLQHLNYVLLCLDGHHFKFSPRLRDFRAESGDVDDVPAQVLPVVPEGTWTISKLNQAAQRALKERFDEPLWLVGELQDYDKNRSGTYRTYFFDLVERPFAGANEVARLKAVLFDSDREAMEQKLRQSDLELRDGVAVRLCGKIDLYPKNGRYQIVIKDIDPAYTAGEIELNRERVFQALKKKGIEEQNRRLAWPICPLRVGLITSVESDAYNDFVHQLRQSGLGFSITAHHANVQGVHTETSVLRALNYFNDRARDFDVVAIVRGGGSRSDLAYFDTEAIGMAVCGHRLKIICGVGHQRDTCLLDLVTESTKTPTAAAERIIGAVNDYRTSLAETYRAIARRGESRLTSERQRLIRNGSRLERQVTRRLSRARRHQVQLEGAIGEGLRRRLEGARRVVGDKERRLKGAAGAWTQVRRREMERVRRELSMRRLAKEFERRRQEVGRLADQLKKSAGRDMNSARRQLDHMAEQLELMDPQRILERGYALIRDEEGVIRSKEDLPIGRDFDVVLADGKLRALRIEDQAEEAAENDKVAKKSKDKVADAADS